jgi:serine protease inhibitor
MERAHSMNRVTALAVMAVAVAMACLLGAGVLRAQKYPGFADYIDSNARFGTKMFKTLHAANPDRNVVFSPIGISSLLACLREETYESKARAELDRVFEWEPEQELGVFHRLFAGRFVVPPAPLPEEERREKAKKFYERLYSDFGDAVPEDFEHFYRSEEKREAAGREEFWIKNALLYHGDLVDRKFNWGLNKAREYFGLEFVHIKNAEQWRAALPDAPTIKNLSDEESNERLFLLENTVQLGTKWFGNTFLLNKPKPGDFHPTSKSTIRVTILLSEFEAYPYAKTDEFETVVLPAGRADFVVILPAEGNNIQAIEDALARNPDLLAPLLKKIHGDVELPEFHFTSDTDFQPLLESLGMQGAFGDFDIVWDASIRASSNLKKVPYRLRGVKQRTDILIDRTGIQAGARTAAWGVWGGIMTGEAVFHMKVNRPFLFQVRDNVTGMLIFMGAVMDPSRHGLP